MHIMIYVLIYSRTSKGLSLGELIHAFYIIIFIPYIIIWECYLHCYINVLHVLDDLWDFHTKSLFLVFNIWEAEYPPFLVFMVSGVSRTQIIKGKIPRQFFFGRRAMERLKLDKICNVLFNKSLCLVISMPSSGMFSTYKLHTI